jgi:hypothetical protein
VLAAADVRYSAIAVQFQTGKGARVTRFRLSRGMIFVVAALLAAGSAWGQAPGGGVGGARGSTPGSRGSDPSHLPGSKPPGAQDANVQMTLQSSVQYRLELLEEDLRVRPEQQNAWRNYRDRVLKLSEDTQRSARTALGGDLSAPQRLDRLSDIARDRLTAIEDIVDAGKQLYATLTPEQQAVADRRLAAPAMALAGVEPNSAAARAGTGGKNP